MRIKFFANKFRNGLLSSVLIGCLLGTIDSLATSAYGDIVIEGWSCPIPTIIVGGNSCSASGCRRSSGEPDSFWVCDYTGGQCPPLEQCENNGG